MRPAAIRAFVDSLPSGGKSELGAWSGLDAQLDALWRAARAAHPELKDEDEAWLGHLACRLNGPHWRAELEDVHAGDLYLAWACGCGQLEALRKFEELFMPATALALRRRGHAPDFADEVIQLVRSRLFLATEGKPKIMEYSGRGELRTWLRAVAVRTALNALRAQPPPGDGEEAIFDLLSEAHPEMAYMKEKYLDDLRVALAEGAAALSSKDRLLLRQFAIDGLSVEELSNLYKVHRVTSFRRLSRARRALVEQTRRALGKRLQLGNTDISSILRLIRSHPDLSLRALI